MTRLLNWDIAFGGLFAALGLAMIAHGRGFPPGAAGVPGPGFFPALIGGLLAACGLLLAGTTGRAGRSYWEHGWRTAGVARIAAILLAIVLYLAAWDVPFLLRTPLFLAAVYRVLGEPWARCGLLAAGLTIVLHLVFEVALSIRL